MASIQNQKLLTNSSRLTSTILPCFQSIYNQGAFSYTLVESDVLQINCQKWGDIGKIVCLEILPGKIAPRFESPQSISQVNFPNMKTWSAKNAWVQGAGSRSYSAKKMLLTRLSPRLSMRNACSANRNSRSGCSAGYRSSVIAICILTPFQMTSTRSMSISISPSKVRQPSSGWCCDNSHRPYKSRPIINNWYPKFYFLAVGKMPAVFLRIQIRLKWSYHS